MAIINVKLTSDYLQKYIMTVPTDHDWLFKELLEHFFVEFMALWRSTPDPGTK